MSHTCGLKNIRFLCWFLRGDRRLRINTAMPQIKKAELIEGIVYVAYQVRSRSHGKPHGRLMTWLGVYEAATSGVGLNDNTTVRLDGKNELQPDALLRYEYGGSSSISEDDYIEGAPELVVEVAASSAENDLHDKNETYCRNGVQEYIVWQVLDEKLDWFTLENGEYVSMEADADGVIKSRVFPGLWLDICALLAGDIVTVLAVLEKGLNSQEHADFLQRLSQLKPENEIL
ncbi:Uma2 family endonuclease [Iningainema tapete]|uniref:Uma2 family endonuclease n=1 Tax=Iningainema tapete BLCC-T55 TaxID=2748662 RepID=A0A8J6Y1H5_9CYAN|nr:Uma2 family endonuclease [Iningainema tapete]MBD2777553.1 Uma2 family endonuclease [Iningainema tapete BLCC-T55]